MTSDRPSGTVVDQDPEPGTMVPPRTLIHIRIASEPVKRLKVPDLQRQTQRQAAATLGHAELRMGRVSRKISDQTPGTVVQQYPRPGTLVPPDFRVQVWLAAAPAPPSPPLPTPLSPPTTPAPPTASPLTPPTTPAPPAPPPPPSLTKVRVPSLVGEKRERAREMLTDARLQEGEVITQKAYLESGTIIAQTPKPGALVPPGTPVTLTVAIAETVVETNKASYRLWLAILAGLLAVLGGGYYGVRKLMRTWLLRAIQVRPKTDMGTQHLALDAPLQLELEVRLKPCMDRGQQDLKADGPLVLEEGEKP